MRFDLWHFFAVTLRKNLQGSQTLRRFSRLPAGIVGAKLTA